MGGALLGAFACGGTEVVVQTVVVEKEVTVVEKVVETVIVEKQVAGETVTEVREVIVEKEVVVEKPVVETVVVEKEVPVWQTVVVETIATAVPVPRGLSAPSGKLTIATAGIQEPQTSPVHCPRCSELTNWSVFETVLGSKRDQGGALVMEPLIADAWETAADGSYTDFTIRKGILFQHGWGELTAEDVALSYNSANTSISPETIHDTGGDLAIVLDEATVLDTYTVRLPWKVFAGNSLPQYASDYWEGISIFSKKAFDELGDEEMRGTPIGSGPFLLTDYVQNKSVTLEAQDEHWRKVPFVQYIEILEVPEASTRRAMLETGQAQMAGVENSDWPEMINKGFALAPEGAAWYHALAFGGNHWETVHPKTGEAIEKMSGFKPELAWVGDPTDEASMEEARTVRKAMSMCIDREGLNMALLGGGGEVNYMPGIPPSHSWHSPQWHIPFDCDTAKQMLASVGWGDGFDIDVWTGPPGGLWGNEIEAVASTWKKELNITVNTITTEYAVFRPSLVDRSFSGIPFSGYITLPLNYPIGSWSSAMSRPGGYNNAIEIPKFSEAFLAASDTFDAAELKEIIIDFHQYNYDERIWTGLIRVPSNIMIDPRQVLGWEMTPLSGGYARSLETVRLAR